MKKLLPFFFVALAGIASAEWRLNPYTQRQDYYEAKAGIAASTGTLTIGLAAEIARATARENAIAVSTGTINADLQAYKATVQVSTASIYSALNSTASALTSEIARATARENDIAASTGTIKTQVDAVAVDTGTITTALTGKLTSPATFYIIKTSDYLVAPASFTYQSIGTAVLKTGGDMTGTLALDTYQGSKIEGYWGAGTTYRNLSLGTSDGGGSLSLLTNGAEPTIYLSGGDGSMTANNLFGSLTAPVVTAASATITGPSFSVGTSTFVVAGGQTSIASNASQPVRIQTNPSGDFELRINQAYNGVDYAGQVQNITGGGPGPLALNPTGGSVGINTTTPGSTLHVAGDETVTGSLTASSMTATGAIQGASVAIGTSSPDELLHVKGSNNTGAVIGSDVAPTDMPSFVGNYLKIINPASGVDRGSMLALGGGYDAGNPAAVTTIFGTIGAFKTVDDTSTKNGYLSLMTNTGTSVTEKMRVTDTGNVGIGTTAPGAKLEVRQTANTSPALYDVKISSANGEHIFGVHSDGHFSLGGYPTALGTCANAALSTNAHDVAGMVNFSGTNSTCAITFGHAFDSTPICVLTAQSADPTTVAKISAKSTTGLTIVPNTGAWANGDSVNYFCVGEHE